MTSATTRGVEHILVVPTLLFHEVGYFQGFNSNVDPYLRILLDSTATSYRPRDQMEQDPSYKQLIPYCIFCCGDQIFHYTRGKLQGEGRLHNKRSIGIGGHISADDRNLFDSPYREAMHREIEEEVHVECPFQEACVGLINDDLTEVGRVHLGIVHVFRLEAAKVRPREKSIIQAGFNTAGELTRDIEHFETWSQICLKALFPGAGLTG